MKKYIALAVVIVLILMVITIGVNNMFSKKQPVSEISISPVKVSLSPTSSSIIGSKKPYSAVSEKEKQQIMQKISISSLESVRILETLRQKMPVEQTDFTVAYSPVLNKFFITKLTKEADIKIKEWAIANNMSSLVNDSRLFTQTNKSESSLQQTAEKIIEKNNNLSAQTTPPPTPIITTTVQQQISEQESQNTDLSVLTDLLSILFSIELTNPIETSVSPTIAVEQPTQPVNTSTPPQTLIDLFNEIGGKIGMPPKILEAVLLVESPQTFNYSASEIGLYSASGNSIPNCGPNVCSAAGPMQMTTGIDNEGSTLCPHCCWNGTCLDTKGGCPRTWYSYAPQVQQYEGSSYAPNPCNLRDAMFAAAIKLKHDSGIGNSTDWTRDNVKQAVESYYGRGGCEPQYIYARLGNRTYCDFVWWYYKNQ